MLSRVGVLLALLVAGGPHDPGVDLAAVRRDGGEALRPDELAPAANASPSGCETGVRRRDALRRAAGPTSYSSLSCVGSLAVKTSRPAATSRPVTTRSPPTSSARLAGAVDRDGVHVQRVPWSSTTKSELAVVPQRLAHARVRGAVAVERRGEHGELAALEIDERDPGVPGVVEHAGVAFDGEPRAVRRPRRGADGAAALREPPRLSAGGGHQVDVAHHLEVPVGMTCGDEGDRPPIRRPGRRVVFVVALGELDRLGRSVGGNDEQVLPPVRRPPHAVELVLQAREPPGAALLVVFLLVGRVAHARHEGDARAVRRPHGLRHVLLEARELARLASGHRHHVQLRRLVRAVGGERQLRAVGRPPRVAVGLLAAREPTRRRRPVGRRQPDRALYSFASLSTDPTT